MRKCFLDDLPTKEGIGRNKGKLTIDWENSIGYQVKFIYDDIEGFIDILDYNSISRKLTIKYNDNNYEILAYHFKDCNLGKILNKISSNHKIPIGEQVGNLIITEHFYVEKNYNSGYKKIKFYKYKCLKCGYKGEISEGHLLDEKRNCPCCSNKITVLGINTIWDTDRWMCDLGVSEEDAKTHTHGSQKTVEVTCPHCHTKKHIRIADVYHKKSIGCNQCGDGISYSEKFMTSLLNQLEMKYIKEYSPKWSNKKRYDFYLENYNCIVECHGMQHYDNGFSSCGGKTLEEEQQNDKYKKELALENGIDNYIVIDCRYSDFDFIKNNILNSELNNILDLSKIDWLKCEKFAITNNLLLDICNYWNNKEDWETTTNMAEIFGIDRHNILKKIRKGSRLGLCNYPL